MNETSLFGKVTESFVALRWRVAGAAALDGFEPEAAAAVARGFFTGPAAVPSDSGPVALAAVSRGFLEEVLLDCIVYILLIPAVFVSFCSIQLRLITSTCNLAVPS